MSARRAAQMAAGILCLAVALPVAAACLKRVEDQTGRALRIPCRPQRVVSLAPSLTEIVFALGRGGRLAGASLFSDYPPQALALPKVGSYVRPDLERILALRPDLCLAVRDGTPLGAVQGLTELGVPVYCLDVRGLDELFDAIGRIGGLLDAQDRADELVAAMRGRIEAVERTLAGVGRRPRVLYQVGADPVITVGGDTFAGEIIRLAGGDNVAKGLSGYPVLDMERVLALAPEVIVVSGMDRKRSLEIIKGQWSAWPQLPAVRDGRVYAVDSNLFDRPGPRVAEAIERLAALLYPGRFPSQP